MLRFKWVDVYLTYVSNAQSDNAQNTQALQHYVGLFELQLHIKVLKLQMNTLIRLLYEVIVMMLNELHNADWTQIWQASLTTLRKLLLFKRLGFSPAASQTKISSWLLLLRSTSDTRERCEGRRIEEISFLNTPDIFFPSVSDDNDSLVKPV